MAKYLVDTDWAVFYLRGKEPFVTALRKYRQEGAAISVVSVAELYEGVYRGSDPSAKEASLHRFLSGLALVDITKPVARLFGQHRAELRKQGIPIADFDILIGCTAIHYGLTLLTNNRKHYERMSGLETISL